MSSLKRPLNQDVNGDPLQSFDGERVKHARENDLVLR
jgi:hypothetical protein